MTLVNGHVADVSRDADRHPSARVMGTGEGVHDGRRATFRGAPRLEKLRR